jgi:hypothetical protein
MFGAPNSEMAGLCRSQCQEPDGMFMMCRKAVGKLWERGGKGKSEGKGWKLCAGSYGFATIPGPRLPGA